VALLRNLLSRARHFAATHARFTLGGLMTVVLAVAIGLAVARLPDARWADGLLAGATSLIVLGLVNQAHDLFRSFFRHPSLTSAQRWGWRLAAAWRIGIATLLASHFLFASFDRVGVLDFLDHSVFGGDDAPLDNWEGSRIRELRGALFFLCLLIAIASGLPQPRAGKRRWSRTGLSALSCLAAALLSVLFWSDQTIVMCLVNHTIFGIEIANSLTSDGGSGIYAGIDPSITARTELFVRQTLLGTCLTLIAAVGFFLVSVSAERINYFVLERRHRSTSAKFPCGDSSRYGSVCWCCS
jgi:hypothetical protein